jgi:hypothetical protein
MWSDGEPIDPSPSIDQAINGGFPDYKTSIVGNGVDGRELATARWGMPSSQHALMEATKKRPGKLGSQGQVGRLQGIAAADGAGRRHDQYP